MSAYIRHNYDLCKIKHSVNSVSQPKQHTQAQMKKTEINILLYKLREQITVTINATGTQHFTWGQKIKADHNKK